MLRPPTIAHRIPSMRKVNEGAAAVKVILKRLRVERSICPTEPSLACLCAENIVRPQRVRGGDTVCLSLCGRHKCKPHRRLNHSRRSLRSRSRSVFDWLLFHSHSGLQANLTAASSPSAGLSVAAARVLGTVQRRMRPRQSAQRSVKDLGGRFRCVAHKYRKVHRQATPASVSA